MTAPTRGPWLDSSVQAIETTKRVAVEQASQNFLAAASKLNTLFSLDDQSYELLALLDGDLDPQAEADLEAQLALVDQMIVEKTEGYVSVIRSLEKMAAARKEEADRLKERAATAEKHADWLKERLLVHMKTTGQERVETTRFTLTVRQNPLAVHVLDAAAVPSEFQRTTISVSVDKRAVLEHAKATAEVVPGVELVRGERLAID